MIEPRLQMTDAAAKMPRPLPKRLLPPTPTPHPPRLPKCCCFFSGDPHPLPLRSPPLPPAPFAILVAVSPGVLSQQQQQQQKGPGQGHLGAKAGRFGARQPLGATCVWSPQKGSSLGPGELASKVRVPSFRREMVKPYPPFPPPQSSFQGPGFAQRGDLSRAAEGSVSPRLGGPGLLRTTTWV